MNLPKVKEILTMVANYEKPPSLDDYVAALKIGSHAVDFILTIRAGSEGKFPPLLPGETEE